METVPTLCATATVVGASAVGLSFGRKTPFDPSHSPSNNKSFPARELHPASMPTALLTSAPSTSATSFAGPVPVAPSSRVSILTRSSQDGRSQRRTLHRKTASSDAAFERPSTVVGIYGSGMQDMAMIDPASHISTRRPSWIKRLSAVSSSQPSSRNPSPAPLSPSVSYSNGSMAFSNDGSTAPIINKRAPSPLPPNKLVKRSLSVRMPHEAPVHGPVSLRPSFRRPATSHQRSAALQHQSVLLEMTAENPSLEQQAHATNTDQDVEFAQFFTAKTSRDRTLTKKRGLSANANGFRRIFPDDKHKPTLVLARSVTVGAEEVEESTSCDGESVFFVSRPETPLSMTAVITTQSATLPPTETSNFRVTPRADESNDAPQPRRSFSITDFISSGVKKQRAARAPGRRLSRRLSLRTNSAPVIPTMSNRPHSTSHVDTRRDSTDPALARLDIATYPSPTESNSVGNDPSGGSSSLPLPDRRVESLSGDVLAAPQLELIASDELAANQTPPSPTLAQSGVRPSRHSMAPSEQASTLVGSSDNEVRGLGSGDEDDADFQSETLFDSLRTGVTRSTSSGPRGPRIETIFDESPPAKIKVTALRDLFPPGAFGDHTINGIAGSQSIAEEEESISTPVRTVRQQRSGQDSFTFSQTHNTPSFPNLISSSPPSMPKPLSLGTLEWDSRAGDDDESSRWSLDEEETEDPWVDLPTARSTTTPASLQRQGPRLLVPGSGPNSPTPQQFTAEHSDRDARSSIFDWSEQQPADKSSGQHTPPRPRTVHGKKDADRRGSRSVGRRASSGLHARSQSVPVVPDATGKRNTVVTNKFGTWGVGSKGVTEDWNDDFDFSELVEDPAAEASDTSPRLDSGPAMVVPKTIQEQQNNVLANIGLLREWGLLIEELKEHRKHAISLGISEGPHSGMWDEVDAMIELADQEADHEGVSRLSPPSSPGFDEGAFDDGPRASPSNSRGRRKSGSPNEDLGTQSVRAKRKTILPPNDEIFAPQSSPIPPKSKFDLSTKIEHRPIVTRPRKDSEAKARLVIEALQKKKTIQEPATDTSPIPSTKKVPFDTATLRRIVPYVSTLTRKVKQVIKEAEGPNPSLDLDPQQEEALSSTEIQPDTDIVDEMKRMKLM